MKLQKSGKILILAYAAWLFILINVLNANTAEHINMTEGISKNSLEEKLLQAKKYNDVHLIDLLKYLISQCTELDPWIPIDENTPKDREILLYWPMFINLEKTVLWKIYNPADWGMYKPTHYKLLQEDPK